MYPEARMIPAMKIWKLPAGKEKMLSEMCSNGEYFLEEKIDGAWYQYEKTENYSYLFSRSISTVTGFLSEKSKNVPHIMTALDCLPKDTIIIGEVFYPGKTCKDVVSIMGCLPELAISRQNDNPIHYYMHDIIMYDGVNLINVGAEDRYKILNAVWNKHKLYEYDFLRLAIKIDENLEEEISRILNNGGEGAVLKKKNYPYTPDKRPAWSTIKIKKMDSVDLVCCGFCDATKEYTGKELETWPYWEKNIMDFSLESEKTVPNVTVCVVDNINKTKIMVDVCHYGEEGWSPVTKPYFYGWKTAIKVGAYNGRSELIELGTVSSGLTDELKQDFSENPDKYLGSVCTLDCMSVDKKEHTLRHPVFKYWRDDKSAKDCLIEEIFS